MVPSGNIDEQETCLITSNETYLQYTRRRRHEQKKQEEEKHQAEQERKERTHRLKFGEVAKEMNFWIRSTGTTMRFWRGDFCKNIQNGTDRGEDFEQAQKHPEIIPDLKKLMNIICP